MNDQRMTMLTNVLEKLALGDYTARCDVTPDHDDLDAIAYSVNVLAEELEIAVSGRDQALEEFAVLNKSLEQRVASATVRLRESEARLKSIFNNSSSPMFMRDTEGRYILINPEYERLWGRPGEEVIGAQLGTVVPQGLAKTLAAQDREVLEKKSGVEIEQRFRFPDGDHTYIINKFPILDGEGAVMGVGGIGTDITARKNAEMALKESEERFRNIFEHSPSAIFLKDLEGRFQMANTKFAEWFKMTSEDLIGKISQEIFPSPNAKRFLEQEQTVLDTGEVIVWEMGAIYPDGVFRTLINTKFPVHDAEGNIVGVGTIATDITERQQAEEERHKSEAKLNSIVENSPSPIFMRDVAGQFVILNPEYRRWWGINPEGGIGQTLEDIFPPGLSEQFKAEDQKILDSLEIHTLEQELEFQGEQITFLVTKFPVIGAHGEVLGVGGINTDISELKKVQQHLEARERQLQTVFDTLPHVIAIKDKEGRYERVNRALCDLFGRKPEEIVGTLPSDNKNRPLAEQEAAEKSDSMILSGEVDFLEEEYQRQFKAGYDQTFIGIRAPLKNEAAEITGMVSLFQDITERKQAEIAVQKSEELFRSTFDNTPVMISVKDLAGRFTVANKRYEEWMGVRQEDMLGKTSFDIYPEDFAEIYAAQDREVLETGATIERVVETPFSGGIIHTMLNVKYPIRDAAGKITGIGTAATDISELARMEKTLRDNERMLQTIFDTVPHWLFVKRLDGRLGMVNQTFASAYGARPEDLKDKRYNEFTNLGEELEEIVDSSDLRVLESDGPIEFEMDSRDRGGITTIRKVIKVPLRNEAGDIVGIVGLSEDITERKRAEATLIKQDFIMRKAQQVAHIGSLEWDLVSKTQTWSDEVFRLVGVEPHAFIPDEKAFIQTLHPEDKSRVLEVMGRAIKGGSEFDLECRVVWPDGTIRHLHAQGETTTDQAGNSIQMIGTAQDITERKNAEEALRNREEQFRSVVEHTPSVNSLKDLEGRYQLTNRRFNEIYEVTSEEVIGGTLESFFPRETIEATLKQEQEMLEKGVPVEMEMMVTTPLGNRRILANTKFPVRNAEGAIVSIGTISTDITKRKEAEASLVKSESLMALSQEIAHIGSIEWDQQSGTQFWSDEVFRILGYEPHAFIPEEKTFSDALHPEDKKRVIIASVRTAESGLPFDQNFRVLRPDGSERIIHARGTRENAENGPSRRVLGTLRDITEQELAQRALRESEELFRSTVENSPSAIFLKDLSGKFRMVNRRFVEWFGISANEAATKTSREMFPAEIADTVQAMDRRVIEGGEVLEGETEVPFADGTLRHVIITKYPVTGSGGKIIGVGTINTDITEIKKADEALRESEERFRSTVEHIPLAMVIKDLEGRYQYINQIFEKWFGISKHSSLGKTSHELFPEDEASQYASMDAVVLQTAAVQEREISMAFADGNEHIVQDLKFPVYGADGEVNGIGVILSDLTKQRQAENQLRQAQKMDAVGQLAGGVAHDFNNMLQVIHGYVRLTMADKNLTPESTGHLGHVLKATERAAALTRQLLAYSRQQVLQKEVIDLNTLVGDQMKMIRRVIGETIELDIQSKTNVLLTEADPGMIEQVLMNLCINARDAMPQGGRLTIRSEEVPANEDFLRHHEWAEAGVYAKISVHDSGTGISREVVEKIFEPFFTTKEQGKGTGLGLSMVYGILKQHDGMVTVESEPGLGSTFNVFLPKSPEPLQEETVQEVQIFSGGKETLLIAEDEADVLELAVTLLENQGYTIHTATNGEEALQIFDQQAGKIDMVILDVVMPKLGGYKVMEKIREIEPEMPILLTTGYAPERYQTEIKPGMGVRLIEKPYDPTQLFQSVWEMLDSRKTGAR